MGARKEWKDQLCCNNSPHLPPVQRRLPQARSGCYALAFIIFYSSRLASLLDLLMTSATGLAAVFERSSGRDVLPELHEQSPLLSQATACRCCLSNSCRCAARTWRLSGVSGWSVAGLYTVTGYALIGLWLLGLAYLALQNHSPSSRTRRAFQARHSRDFGVWSGCHSRDIPRHGLQHVRLTLV